jgi:hypothetical protein
VSAEPNVCESINKESERKRSSVKPIIITNKKIAAGNSKLGCKKANRMIAKTPHKPNVRSAMSSHIRMFEIMTLSYQIFNVKIGK